MILKYIIPVFTKATVVAMTSTKIIAVNLATVAMMTTEIIAANLATVTTITATMTTAVVMIPAVIAVIAAVVMIPVVVAVILAAVAGTKVTVIKIKLWA